MAAPADDRVGAHAIPVRFSVVIPVRNDATWLPGALESVLAQDYGDWELVVGDNASSEDIAGLVAGYADPRIRYHRFEKFVGIDENFNRTALLGRFEWIHLLCADDRLRPGALSALAGAIREHEQPGERLALAIGDSVRLFADGTRADRIWYGSRPRIELTSGRYEGRLWFDLMLDEPLPSWNPGSISVARWVLEETGGFFRPEVGLSCDWELVIRAAAYGDVAYVHEPLLDFLVRSDADNAIRLWADRRRGTRWTPVGTAIYGGLRVHEHRRSVGPAERGRALAAISRSHLQRAGQHRILPDGLGRRGALGDVLRAIRVHPRTALRPSRLAYALAVVAFPRSILERAQRRLAARHPG